MFDGWFIISVALGYITALFLIAWVGDIAMRRDTSGTARPLVYALSLAVYCTSWTFFGSVGRAASTGYEFIPVYIGPIVMFALGWPLILRIVRLAKSQNITSVADFIAARYGKSQEVAAVVTLVAVVGTLPYIALQLKAVSVSIETLLGGTPLVPIEVPTIGFTDTAFIITIILAAFAVLFGTRHIDATEHQDGLMVAIAAESLVKLAAFIAVGLFVVFYVFNGFGPFMEMTSNNPQIATVFGQSFNGGSWLTVSFLSFVCIILLPRQFHVTVVENHSEQEIRRAAWLFPSYLVLINLFVVPIAAAGLLLLPAGVADPDFYVLGLPMAQGSKTISLLAFIGGLSSATAMVIVESIALAVMVSNGVVIPLLLTNRIAHTDDSADMARTLLAIRRVSIVVLLLLGYIVYRALGKSQELAAIGLISFAAIAQLAPAFFGGLIWRNGTARGAMAGMLAGFAMWCYTLLLPWAAKSGLISMSIVVDGPFHLGFLQPQALFYLQFEPLTHGVLWSLGTNFAAFITVSLLKAPEPVERLQAHIFVQDSGGALRPTPPSAFRVWRSAICVGDLQSTVARYLGHERAERAFAEFAKSRSVPLRLDAEGDLHFIRFTEHLLASAIGAASSRLVLSLLLRRNDVSTQSALKLLDDASEALQYNRDLLQSALDQVRHGLAVFDRDLQLTCWNRQFRELLELPAEFGRVGAPLDSILRFCAERGDLGTGSIESLVADRLNRLSVTQETFLERVIEGRRMLEIRTAPMPQGGIVVTYSDITDRVEAALALERANETLERRVRERTGELLEVNTALGVAKAKADEANLDKTRFIAAASHDILQPLNAARLYATSLAERPLPEADTQLARNLDASLSSVEEIFGTLIDISRLDAGRLEPEMSATPLSDILEQLKLEFEPMAAGKGLDLQFVPTTLWVQSDRRLLRRLLQNLVSNAIKYTPSGRIVVGARRATSTVTVSVLDTGPGIPEDKRVIIFKEFQRLAATAAETRGLGLGLSIVERIAKVLGARVGLTSTVGRGTAFSVTLPRAQRRTGTASPSRGHAPVLDATTGLPAITALCIDNEPAVLDAMATLLTGWGWRVVTARDRTEALTSLSTKPDVVLADFHLDTETGLDVIAAIRRHLGYDLPAIIITADQSLEVQRDVRLLGIGLLRKPLRAAALRALIAQHILRRNAAE